MSFTFFVCQDPEEAWYAHLQAESDREQERWEREQDLEREEELAHEFIADEEDIETWPWYANPPIDEIESEIFDGCVADLPMGMILDASVGAFCNKCDAPLITDDWDGRLSALSDGMEFCDGRCELDIEI